MPFGAVAGAVASAAITAGVGALTSGGQSAAIAGGSAEAQALDEAARKEGRTSYDRDFATAQPFVDTGTNALMRSADFAGLNGTDAATNALAGFTASPGYQYQLEQGLRGVDAGAASKGLLRSGATLKAEQTLGNNLANQDFTAYLGRLNTLAGFGVQGAQLQGQDTSTYNNLLTKTTSDQTGVITGTAGQNATILGNAGKSIGDAAGSFVKNSLYDTAANGQTSGSGATYSGTGYSAGQIAQINDPYNY